MKIGRISAVMVVVVIGVVLMFLAVSNGDDSDQTTNADRNLSDNDSANTQSERAAQLLASGNAAFSSGDPEQAINDYSAALNLEFDDDALIAELYYHRAIAYSEIGAWEAAIADFSTVIERDKLAVEALVGRGDLYYRLGDYENALADVDAALDIDPDNAAAIVTRGAVYVAQENHAEAIQTLDIVVGLDSDYATAYFYRSVAHYNSGDQFAALQDLNQALQLDTQNAAAHYVRGLVYDKESDAELALSDFSRAIQLDPTYAAAYRARSWIYARQGQVNASRSDRQNAMLVDPTVAGVSVGNYDLTITRVWATNSANGRRPSTRDQFLVLEISVYNYATTELCLNRTDFPRLRNTERILVTSMYHVGQQFYPGTQYPPGTSQTFHCVPPLSVWNTFLAYDTERDIRDITIEFSPVDETTTLTLLLLPTESDYAFALSALNGESITVVGDVVITDEVRTKVLESRTAVLDNCLGTSERARTDTIEHEVEFSVEIDTTVRQSSGNSLQAVNIEANSIGIRPNFPYVGQIIGIMIGDLQIHLEGKFGDTRTEETTTSETTRRVIHSSIAVTTTAAPGTRESTLVTWYLVNKLGYVETTINGTLYQVPFSITDTLEADPVSLPPEACDQR